MITNVWYDNFYLGLCIHNAFSVVLQRYDCMFHLWFIFVLGGVLTKKDERKHCAVNVIHFSNIFVDNKGKWTDVYQPKHYGKTTSLSWKSFICFKKLVLHRICGTFATGHRFTMSSWHSFKITEYQHHMVQKWNTGDPKWKISFNYYDSVIYDTILFLSLNFKNFHKYQSCAEVQLAHFLSVLSGAWGNSIWLSVCSYSTHCLCGQTFGLFKSLRTVGLQVYTLAIFYFFSPGVSNEEHALGGGTTFPSVMLIIS